MAFLRLAARWCPLIIAALCRAQPLAEPEYQIKAAYLYNFAKFVDWSQTGARSDGPLTICVLGRDPFGDALTATLAGRLAQGRQLLARHLEPDGDPAGCHMVFFGACRLDRLAPALRRAEHAGAVTVGETREFEDRQGMIRFIAEGGKVRFEVNLDPVHRSRLQLSSQLLKVARAVHGKVRPAP